MKPVDATFSCPKYRGRVIAALVSVFSKGGPVRRESWER